MSEFLLGFLSSNRSVFYAALFAIYITQWKYNGKRNFNRTKIIEVAESKTIAYKALGLNGQVTMFIKAILCNWMVTIGAVMAFTSKATIGKIVAMWMPVFKLFAQGI